MDQGTIDIIKENLKLRQDINELNNKYRLLENKYNNLINITSGANIFQKNPKYKNVNSSMMNQ